MPYRFTNTDKWNDTWFSELRLSGKALFLYLCDQCDIAGFLELNLKKIAFDLGIGKKEVEGALKELESRLIYSTDGRIIFIKNFIKHQKNYPLNENNKAHLGIIRRLESNLYLFGLDAVEDYFLGSRIGGAKPLSRGLGIGKDKVEDESKSETDKGGTGGKEDRRTATLMRKENFYNSLITWTEKYPKEMIRAFFEYWTELNKSGTKMRFELQQTWETGKRLATWSAKDKRPQRYTKSQEPIREERKKELINRMGF